MPDTTTTPAAVCSCPAPDDRYLLEVAGEKARIVHAACMLPPALPVEAMYLCWVPLRLHWQEWRDEEGEPQQFGELRVDGLPFETAEAARLEALRNA